MDFPHYPKQPSGLVVSAVYPVPPDRPNFKTLPRLSETNMIRRGARLEKDSELETYHSAIDFSCYSGSVACDVPVEYGIYFSNDEVDEHGHWITDRALPDLHWDVTAKVDTYTPGKAMTGLFILTSGRWIKVRLKLLATPTELRFYLRGRTF